MQKTKILADECRVRALFYLASKRRTIKKEEIIDRV